ncbi:MAG TPA: FtsX-like permease family protein [Terriglobia bacterium]|nr:FtsX-like permease family protein [Terriglobia bacterium]
MLVRIIRESLVRRRRRKLLSFAAVALGIAAATTVATIAIDVGDKVSRELRSFGANISITPAADGLPVAVGGVDYRPAGEGAFLAEGDLVKLKRIFWRHNIVAFAPFVYAPASISGRSTVLIGTWFDEQIRVEKSDVFHTGLKELHPAWKVEGGWPDDGDAGADVLGCLVGRRLARTLGAKPGQVVAVQIDLPTARGSSAAAGITAGNGSGLAIRAVCSTCPAAAVAQFTIRGILESGGPEEDQVFAPLAAVQRLAGLEGKVRRVEVSALTKPEDAFARADVTKLNGEEFDRWYCTPYASSIAYQIRQVIPGAEAKPVYQVADTEGKIMDRVGILMWALVVAALATAALAVASMMLANVLERRAEIGLFKSLGATDARVVTLFMLEALVIGLAGGVAGYLGGTVLARSLAATVFGAPSGVHWVILPAALAVALLVALAGSALPLARVLKFSPAVVLRD